MFQYVFEWIVDVEGSTQVSALGLEARASKLDADASLERLRYQLDTAAAATWLC